MRSGAVIRGCPRCNGSLFEEAGDVVCLSCGWRQLDARPPLGGNGRGVMDPFDAALAAVVTALDAVQRLLKAHERKVSQRGDQARRLRQALTLLNRERPGRNAVCPDCGTGRRSVKHRDECLRKPVGTVNGEDWRQGP